MNKFFLALIRLLKPLWVRLGVNVPQLMAILDVKLKMDDRRPNAYTHMRQQKKKEQKYGSLAVVLISFLMGVFYLFVFTLSSNPLMQLFIWFSVFMVMLSITLISDFTSVLIDVKDNFVILPKPVSDKTVVVSRILHIMVHVSKIVLPLMLPAFIWLAVTQGAAVLWFGVLVFLLSVLCIFLINAVYLLALKLTTPERFKEVLNYVQIIFSVIVFATYYLVPRLTRNLHLDDIDLWAYPLLNLAPSFWFAAAYAAVAQGTFTLPMPLYIVLSLVVPVLSLWLVVKVFAPSFNRKLAMLGGSGGDAPAVKKPQAGLPQAGRMQLYKRLAAWFSRGRQEQLAFELVWLITGRSREFKLKVYPSLAYVLVYFVFFMLSGKHTSAAEAWNKLSSGNAFVILIYSSTFVFITAITNLVYSDKFRAGWVYYAAPVEAPGPLLMGSFKAAFVKFFLPFYVVIAIFSLAVWGFSVVPDLLLGLVNVALVNIIFAFIFLRKLPFATEINVKQGAGGFLKGLMVLIVPGTLGMLHYATTLLRGGKPVFGIYLSANWLVMIFAMLSAAAFYLLQAKYRETSWEVLER